MSTNRFITRLGMVAATAGAVVLLGGGVASAHVTASVSGQAAKGGYAKITFRVPDEDPVAGTTKVEVTIPADYELTSVRTKPVPGWTAAVTKAKSKDGDKDIVTGVTWTADQGARIAPGEFGEFDISAGPLPRNIDTMVLPATQTYDNNKVVKWDAPPAEGQEPEHPAPTIELVEAAGDDHHGGGAAPGITPAASATGDNHAATSGEDGTARLLGGAGLAVGALGLGLGVGATLRARKVTARNTAKTEEITS